MAPLEYQDLVLVAEDIATDEGGALESFTVRVFDSPVGQDRGKERVRVPSRLRAELTALGGRLLDFDAVRQVGTGRMLGEMLLPPRSRVVSAEPGSSLTRPGAAASPAAGRRLDAAALGVHLAPR